MIEGTQGQDEVITGPSKKRKWPLWLGAITAGALLTFYSLPTLSLWFNGVPNVDGTTVQVSAVFKGDLIRDVAVSGRLVAANAPQLYSTEPGVVQLTAKPGDAVSNGDVIAMIDSPELHAELRQAQAVYASLELEAKRGELEDKEVALDLNRELDNAKVALNAAKREKARADESYDQNVISELDWVKANDVLLEAELTFKHASEKVLLARERLAFEGQNRQSKVEQQRLVLDELERRMAQLVIRAPFSGVIGNWLVEQKEKVTASAALLTIVDLSQYEAELNVPEFYADDLGIGLAVTIQIGGQTLDAKIASVSPEILNNQVQVKARITATESLNLRQNQRLNARIEFERKDDVLMVKRGAFYQSGAGVTAYRLDDDGVAHKTAITTGAASVDFIEVLAGLDAKDTIIISDYADLLEHSAVRLDN